MAPAQWHTRLLSQVDRIAFAKSDSFASCLSPFSPDCRCRQEVNRQKCAIEMPIVIDAVLTLVVSPWALAYHASRAVRQINQDRLTVFGSSNYSSCHVIFAIWWLYIPKSRYCRGWCAGLYLRPESPWRHPYHALRTR
jgi:hypothetical protein